MRLVLDEPAFVGSATTDQVAKRAGVSAATVVRAARAAGFGGFADLKLALARAAGAGSSPDQHAELTTKSTIDDVCAVVLASHGKSIHALPATLASAPLSRAVSLLKSARHILLFGVGTSAAPAADAAYRWTTIGCQAQAVPDTRTAQLQARLLTRDDVLVAI